MPVEDLSGFNPISQEPGIGEAEDIQFPTLESIINDDRFRARNVFEQAKTLKDYRDEYASYIAREGLVANNKELQDHMLGAEEKIRQYINPNDLSAFIQTMATFNPAVEGVAEFAGLYKTQLEASLERIKEAPTSLSPQISNPRTKGRKKITKAQRIKQLEAGIQEVEFFRQGAEQVISEDVEREGRDFIGQGGLNLSTVGQSINRMVFDLPAATAAGMVSGGVGTFSYYGLTAAARSDRAQRNLEEAGLVGPRSARERQARGFLTGGAVGALDAASFGIMTNVTRSKLLSRGLEGMLRGVNREIPKAAIAEASTEFLQSWMETFGNEAESLEDALILMNEENAKQAGTEALIGGLLGGGIRGTSALVNWVSSDGYQKALAELNKQKESIDIDYRPREAVSDLPKTIYEQINNDDDSLQLGDDFVPKEFILKVIEDAKRARFPKYSIRDGVQNQMRQLVSNPDYMQMHNIKDPQSLIVGMMRSGHFDKLEAEIKEATNNDPNVDIEAIAIKAANRVFGKVEDTEIPDGLETIETTEPAAIQSTLVERVPQPEVSQAPTPAPVKGKKPAKEDAPVKSLRDMAEDMIRKVIASPDVQKEYGITTRENVADYLIASDNYDIIKGQLDKLTQGEQVDTDKIINRAINRQFNKLKAEQEARGEEEFNRLYGDIDLEVDFIPEEEPIQALKERAREYVQREREELQRRTTGDDPQLSEIVPSRERRIREHILAEGGIDIRSTEGAEKDAITSAENLPSFSPKFKALRGRGLSIDKMVSSLKDANIIEESWGAEDVINALHGNLDDIERSQIARPGLSQLQDFDEQGLDFMSFKPSEVGVSDPKIQSKSKPTDPIPLPDEVTPVPLNLNKDNPDVVRDTRRKLRTIGQIVERELKIPVRKGKANAFRAALGIYKRQPDVIRTKFSNDLQVIAHEVGHGVSNRLGLNVIEDIDAKADQELQRLGAEQTTEDSPIMTKREEGRAEYMRAWLINPEYAASIAPNFHAEFTERLSLPENADLKLGLDKLQSAYADISSQSAVERLLAGIVSEEDIKPQVSFKDKVLATKTRLIDQFAPIQDATQRVYSDKDISILDNPYLLSRLGKGSSSVANYFVKNGLYTSDGYKITGGLAPIVKGMTDVEFADFDAYLKARRTVIDLAPRGLVQKMEVDNSIAAISEYESKYPEFKSKAADLKEFTDGLIKYAVAEGVLSIEDAMRIMDKGQAYIPFARAYDEIGGKGQTRAGNPFRTFTGDTHDTLSGLATLESNVRLTVQAAANTRIYRALHEMSKQQGAGMYVEEIDIPNNKFQGVPTDEPIFTFIDPITKKQIALRVKDELLLEALNGHPVHAASAVAAMSWDKKAFEFAKKAARLVQRSAITNPAFILKNVVRDTQAASIQSKNNFIPVVDSIVGLLDILNKTDMYEKFQISGAGQSTFNRLLTDGKDSIIGRKSKTRVALDVLTSPIRALEHVAQLTEEATRVGDFRKTYNRMISKGATEAQAIAQAAFESRDLTIDFQKAGTAIKDLNQYVPFLNANIQGKTKFWQALNTRKGLYGTAALVIVPELIIWSALKDDEDYQEVPEYIKDNYWLLPDLLGVTDGPFIQIPKPQGYLTASSIIRDSLNSLTGRDKKDAMDHAAKLGKSIKGELINIIPSIAKPALEVQTNYSFFREQPIIGEYIKDLPIKEQYNSYTSELAKKVGPALGVSPIYFDHLVYGYATGWGSAATSAIDAVFLDKVEDVPVADPELGRSTFAELSGLKSFLGNNPNYMAISVQEIFNMSRDLQGLERSMKNKTLEEKQEIILDNKLLWDQRNKIKSAKGRIGSIGKRIQSIYESKEMSSADKKKELRREFDTMLEVARKALDKK